MKAKIKNYRLMNAVLPAFIFIATCTVFLAGCNDDKKPEKTDIDEKKETGPATLTNVNTWQYFKLTRKMIEDSIDKLGYNKNPQGEYTTLKNTRIILKLRFKGVTNTTFNHDLLAYPTTDHREHGRAKGFVELKDTFLFKTLRDTIIIGNNYLNWDAIHQLVFITSGANKGKLRPDFGYLLFEPFDENNTTFCPNCAGHLWYKVRYFDINGREYTPGGGGGQGGSNPSPPADPGS